MKITTQTCVLTVFALACALLLPARMNAHPGSGIVVDRQGNIYFVDTGAGVWMIGRDGKLTRHQGPAYHWMAIDLDGRLRNVPMPSFSLGDATVTQVGADATLLLASDFPIVVGRDGSLYYPWVGSGDRLQVVRLAPSGRTSVLTTLPVSTESGPLRWLNGIAAGPDSSIYFTDNRAVRKITPNGQVSTILRTSSPWSPTGVAVYGNDLYVLEYLHTESDTRREWLPRVRKLASDGRVVTVAAIDRR